MKFSQVGELGRAWSCANTRSKRSIRGEKKWANFELWPPLCPPKWTEDGWHLFPRWNSLVPTTLPSFTFLAFTVRWGRRFKWFSCKNFKDKNGGHQCGKTEKRIDSVFAATCRAQMPKSNTGGRFLPVEWGLGGTAPNLSLILLNFYNGLMLKFPRAP